MGKFGNALQAFANLAPSKVDAATKKIALEILRRIVERTPVDTGTARARWQVSTAARANRKPSANRNVESVISREEAKILEANIGSSIFLLNNMPYIYGLEYGSSKQAPEGMVRITVAEFQGIVKAAL